MENLHVTISNNQDDDASLVTYNGNTGPQDQYNYRSYFDTIPPGYRFKPLDEELVVFYLMKKIAKEELPPNKINEVELSKFSPDFLAEHFKLDGVDDRMWYFFTPREKKYPKGSRPNRAAGDGYWKASGAGKGVIFNNVIVGCKTSLVFLRGRSPYGVKTDWKMHEYTIPDNQQKSSDSSNMMLLDEWVLCRIYKNLDRFKSSNQSNIEGISNQSNMNGISNQSNIDGVSNQSNSDGVSNQSNSEGIRIEEQSNYLSYSQSNDNGNMSYFADHPPANAYQHNSDFPDQFPKSTGISHQSNVEVIGIEEQSNYNYVSNSQSQDNGNVSYLVDHPPANPYQQYSDISEMYRQFPNGKGYGHPFGVNLYQ